MSCNSAPRLIRSGSDLGSSASARSKLTSASSGNAGFHQNVGAVAVRLGEIGVEGDGRVEILDRLQRLAQRFQRAAEQIVRARRRRLGERAAGEIGALLELPLLAGDHRDVIERVGVLGVGAQHLRIALHRLLQVALAVVEQALLDELRDGGGGGGRGHEALVSRDWRCRLPSR